MRGESTAGPINLAARFNPAPAPLTPARKQKRRSSRPKLKAQCTKLSNRASAFLTLADLGFDLTSYDVLMLGPNNRTLAAFLPAVRPMNLEMQGPQADLQEWLSQLVLCVGQGTRSADKNRPCEILYADGSKELCLLLANGQKDGPYQRRRIRTQQGYFYGFSTDEWGGFCWDHREEGSYFHGIPCGKFTVQDDNNQILCAGRYELMETGSDEAGQTINVTELYQRLERDERLRYIRHKEHAAWVQGAEIPAVTKQVRANAIVARYHTLSRILPNDMCQSFTVGPELPAVMIERQENETWYEACRRTHQAVLALVQEQIAALHEAQRAAYDVLNVDAPAHLRYLGQVQPSPLIRGAKRGGFWGIILQTLPQAPDGAYLSGLLVSSESFLKIICTPEYQAPVAHYSMYRNNRLVQAPVIGGRALPIWALWAPRPVLSPEGFCWQAQGTSAIKDPAGEDSAVITYGNLGLCEGTFDLYNQAPATAEHGTFKQGLLEPSFSFEHYQDFRARFPAVSFTLDVRTGEPDGPFKLYFTIDHLFNQGYHAVLLETCDDIKTEHGTKTQKRLRAYIPGSYLSQAGTFNQGRLKLTKRRKLRPYRNPQRYYDWYDPYYYD